MSTRARNVLNRRDVVSHILARRGDALLVTGLGSTAWDAAATGDHDNNFYLWGAMGGAALVGLGLALAQPTRRVLVLTGDGEMLMGLGGLATIAVQKVQNLCVIVIDNEHYGETGLQETHTRYGVDLAAVADATGFARTLTVRNPDELELLVPAVYEHAGPVFVDIKVTTASESMVLPPRDGPYLKNRFRAAVLGPEATR